MQMTHILTQRQASNDDFQIINITRESGSTPYDRTKPNAMGFRLKLAEILGSETLKSTHDQDPSEILDKVGEAITMFIFFVKWD